MKPMKPFLFSFLALALGASARADFNANLSVPGSVSCGQTYSVSGDVEENENGSYVELWIYKNGSQIAYGSNWGWADASANESGSGNYSAHYTSGNGDDAWRYGDTTETGCGGGGGTPTVTITASASTITTGQTVVFSTNAQTPSGYVQYINVDRVSHGGFYGTNNYADADNPDYGAYWVGGNSANVTRQLTLIFNNPGTYVFRGATWANNSGWYYSPSDVTVTVTSGGGGGGGSGTQTFTTSGTFTVPAGVTSVGVLVVVHLGRLLLRVRTGSARA